MGKKPYILIIDDARDLAEVLSLSLKQHGYEVKVANTGSEGIHLNKQEQFDLIITDLNMPEMDGIQFIGNARKMNPRQKIIVITAHPSQWTPWNKRLISRNLEKEVVKQEDIKCLPKPFKAADLLRIIGEFFDKNGDGN